MKKSTVIVILAFALVLVGIVIYSLFNEPSYSVERKSTTDRQISNETTVIKKETTIFEKIELLSCEVDYFIRRGRLCRGLGAYHRHYYARIRMDWKNISNKPLSESIRIDVTVINNYTREEIGNHSNFILLSSGPPFLPNTIRNVSFRDYLGANIVLAGRRYADISFHIYVNRDYYKEELV